MKVILPFLALAAVAPAQEIVVSRQDSSALKGTMAYNRAKEITFSGRVTGKLKADGVNGNSAPVRILVKTSTGATSTVDLGPTWYMRDQFASINVGDKVTVTGSKFNIAGINVVNARMVKKGRSIVALRDNGGFPYWVARRQEAPPQPTSGGVSGRIARMQKFTINGQTFNGVVIQTDQGERSVLLAPDWYYDQQNIQLAPGTFISAYGGAYGAGTNLVSPVPGLYIAGSVYGPGSYYGFTTQDGYAYGNFPGFPRR